MQTQNPEGFACCFDTGQSSLTQESPQEPPEAKPPETGFDRGAVPQKAQTQVFAGEEPFCIDTAQLQHPNAPVEHNTSQEGISHFDDGGDAEQIHDQARQSVGLGNMSVLQASLPVGVSMTIDSSQ